MARSTTLTRAAPVAGLPQDFKAPPGRAVALGRDGKPIYRQLTQNSSTDPYAIDPRLHGPDWVYEWKRYSIYNQVDHTNQATLSLGGWTAVPADRHDGRFLPPGSKGPIIRDGLILMERPISLHQEALREEKRAADDKMRSAKSNRGLAPPPGAGVATDTPEARGATFINQTRATADDMQALAELPRGNYDRETNTID